MRTIIMFNDDYTPAEFVMDLLMSHFQKANSEAASLTAEVHFKGKAIAGSFTAEIAEEKAFVAQTLAKAAGHPFRIEIQEP